jgi:hypothetical protein
MKLLFCKNCYDLQKLDLKTNYCKCGDSSGKYCDDGDFCQISGDYAIVVGIDNNSFRKAVINDSGLEMGFMSWVFANDYYKIKKI